MEWEGGKGKGRVRGFRCRLGEGKGRKMI